MVERRRIRYAHMVSVTPQIMQEGMRADYKQGGSIERSASAAHADGHAC